MISKYPAGHLRPDKVDRSGKALPLMMIEPKGTGEKAAPRMYAKFDKPGRPVRAEFVGTTSGSVQSAHSYTSKAPTCPFPVNPP